MSQELGLWQECAAELPFWELFDRLRSQNLLLCIDDYELLIKALGRAGSIGSWDDLQRVCELLWVKPSENFDLQIFRRVFRLYREERQAGQQLKEPAVVTKNLRKPKQSKLPVEPVWPVVPPRHWTAQSSEREQTQGILGVLNQDTALRSEERRFEPHKLPIDIAKVRDSWRSLQQTKSGWRDEIDLAQTVAQVARDGFLVDVAMKSSVATRSELVVLVDEGGQCGPMGLLCSRCGRRLIGR